MEKTKIETKIYYSELLTHYGKLLTQKQYDYMEQYFQEDYSLSEIAENYEVSRVAIHTQIQKACQKLEMLEQKLRLHYIYETYLVAVENALISNDIAAIAAATEAFKNMKDGRDI
ncbi:MAG: sigma factor-like helix-turn-helix DNA-binding protein [Culicoidibacterales bacterium]